MLISGFIEQEQRGIRLEIMQKIEQLLFYEEDDIIEDIDMSLLLEKFIKII